MDHKKIRQVIVRIIAYNNNIYRFTMKILKNKSLTINDLIPWIIHFP